MNKTLIRLFFPLSFVSINFTQTGIPVPEMTACENRILELMQTYDVPGGTVALA